MKSQYVTGRYFEFITKNWLERNGYYCTRSAGSHGAFDLVAFPLVNVSNSTETGLDSQNPIVIQLKSVNKEKIVNNSQWVNFLWSKEFEQFRDLKFKCIVKKYVFIYNSKSQKELPMVLEFDCNDKWIGISNSEFINPMQSSLVGYKG